MADDERETPPVEPESWAAEKTRLETLWRAGRVVVGVPLIALGAVGCVLPVVPGIPLLIAGVALLGPRHWLVRPFTDRVASWRQR